MIRPMPVTLDHLRRHAVARSLFNPTTLPAVIRKLCFVQADPIRAPDRRVLCVSTPGHRDR